MIIEVTQSSVLVGANNLDNTPDGTVYKRIAAALATAINNETRLPTALGTADANAIAAATGATLAARLVGLAGPTIAGGGYAVPQAHDVATNIAAADHAHVLTPTTNAVYLLSATNISQGWQVYGVCNKYNDAIFYKELVKDTSLFVFSISGNDIILTNGSATTDYCQYTITQIGWN